MRRSIRLRLLAATCLNLGLAALAQAQTANGPVTTYPPAYFAASQAYTALEMVKLLPGFVFDAGDAEVRGFAGAVGNVLIDGRRPTSKQESLEDVLKRIPARSVARVELIRAGAGGVDMQGRSLVANVVRTSEAVTRGRVEAGSAFYDNGRTTPRVAAEMDRQWGDRRLELSGAVYRTLDGAHGWGARDFIAPDLSAIRLTRLKQPEGSRFAEAAGAYQQGLAGGQLRLNGSAKREQFRADIVERVRFPAAAEDVVIEQKRVFDTELGAHYDRPLGAKTQIELLALRKTSDVDGGERSADEAFSEASKASESIARVVLRRGAGPVTLEAGAEAALNILDSHIGLQQGGAPVTLPAANVRVEEKRGEAFANASWQVGPRLALEAGVRAETSTLTQSGDSGLSKTLTFLKPRALAVWSPNADNQVRLLVEREVGQLDFADFASTTSLSSGTVTAGNPDLEPDKIWRAELTWERRFLDTGALSLTVRHEEITDVVDRAPVIGPGYVFDSAANIGDGRRDELEASLTLPLDRLGLKGGLLRAEGTVRDSKVTDPTTGVKRRISGDYPFQAALHFTHDLPARHARWGLDVTAAQRTRSYLFDEVLKESTATQVDLFAEYRPTPAWNVRVYLNNLMDRVARRDRDRYDGLREAVPLGFHDIRRLKVGRSIGLTIQRDFGA
jgi:hypothetical protein